MHVNRKTGLPGFQKKLLCTAITLSLLPISGAVLAQDDEEVEEIIVTGSFIRRTEGFRSASPLTQLTLEDIAAEGTPNIGDIVHNLSFNQGSSISSNITPGSGATETRVNIRGLGAGATLDLVDGKRPGDGNTNIMLPQIAIQRLDIVVDGAAALYGSAAVAGVVNFVPIKSYDGFKFEAFNQQDSRGDYMEQMYSMLWGGDVGGWDIVTALQWRDNENLRWVDRPKLFYSGFNVSSSGNPGQFRVPTRNEDGTLTGSTARRADANCGGAEREDPTNVGSNRNGSQWPPGSLCRMDFGEWWELNPHDQQGVFYANASYEFDDDWSLNLQLHYNNETYDGQNSASNPGGRVADLPVIRGELPGNPYQAVNASGAPVLAADRDGDGLPDRGPITSAAPYGVVLLDPVNGIPFNEDVTFSGWRPFGKSQTRAAGHNGNGSFPGFSRERSVRINADLSFPVPFLEGWDGVASVNVFEKLSIWRENNQSFSAIEQGLNCDTLLHRDSCFSPFAVSDNVLDPYTNSQAVADSIFPTQMLRGQTDSDMYTMDVILNGQVPMGNFELPGGPISMAIGAQRRGNGFDYKPFNLAQSGDLYNGQQDIPANHQRHVDAWFVEIAIPVLDNLEITAASRNETYNTGQSSSDPKFGIVYSPFDWLTVRATKGTAFVAPGLNSLYAPERCNLSNIDDPFSTFFAYARRCQSGNPGLTPETADTSSAGVTLEPIENLRIDLNYSKTDFRDRFVSVDPQQLLNLDFYKFKQATGFSGTGLPSYAQLQAWNDSGSDPRIERNPTDLGQILRVVVGTSNASMMLVEAFDLQVSYQFDLGNALSMIGLGDLDAGTMTINSNVTKIDKWEYQKFPTDPVSSPLGKRNRFLGEAPPLPELKGNIRLGWVMGSHSANLIGRYIDEVDFDGYNWKGITTFQYFTPFDPAIRDVLRASTVADAAYNYRGLELFGGSFDVTLGCRNCFDRMPQRVNDFAGMESILYDARGRLIYGRITMEF